MTRRNTAPYSAQPMAAAAEIPAEAPAEAPAHTPAGIPGDAPAEIHSGDQVLGSWHIAWAQANGRHHDRCEDSLDHRGFALPALGAASNGTDVAGAGSAASAGNPGSPGMGLAIALADGVGGGARGDVASRSAVDHCVRDLPAALLTDDDGLARWLRLAEARVQLALRQVTFGSGATTLVAAWLGAGGAGWLVHVGDSRAYPIGRDKAGIASARALTQDHTFAQLGEAPPEGTRGDDLARMVGANCMGDPLLLPLRLAAGDLILLCSDGLHRHVPAQQLAATLLPGVAETPAAGLGSRAQSLVAQALAAGSHDDVSVLVVQRLPG